MTATTTTKYLPDLSTNPQNLEDYRQPRVCPKPRLGDKDLLVVILLMGHDQFLKKKFIKFVIL